MNVSKTAVYLLLLLSVTAVVPVHVWGQSGARERNCAPVCCVTRKRWSLQPLRGVTAKGKRKYNALQMAFRP
jgi:hypothetical protein